MIKQLIKAILPRWSKWTLLTVYVFNATQRTIEVRQNLKTGRLQFRNKRVAWNVYGQLFSVEDVRAALDKLNPGQQWQ